MDEAGVAGWVTSDELAEAGRFVREGRRREYLTWRAVVRRELGADVRIAYDAAGARSSTGTGYTSGFRTAGGVWPSVCPMSPARSTSNPRRGISAVPRRVTCPPPSWRCPAIRCCLPLSGAPRRRSTNMPAPGAGLAARPAGGGGGFCGWNRCRAHRRRGGDPAHAASCRRVYHGIYGIVPAGLPHGKAPPREGLSHMCPVRAAQALRRLRRP